MYVCLATKDLTLSFPHHFWVEIDCGGSGNGNQQQGPQGTDGFALSLCEGGFEEDVGLEMA